MSAADAAKLTLGLFVAAAVVAVAWQAWRCPSGPTLWGLYVAERLMCGLVWHVRGVGPDGRPKRCPFPTDSAALIVANHRSPADPVALWQNSHLADPQRKAIRPIGFLMAREIYENPKLNWFYRAMRAIPVTRGGQDTAAVRQAVQRLKAGDLIGIFPEGAINKGPRGLKEANPGVAFLALSVDVPVYPVYIAGAPTDPSMLRAFLSPARIRLVYGDPVDLSPWRGRKKTPELLAEATDRIMTAIADLGGVEYAGSKPHDADEPATIPVRPKEADGAA